MMRAFINYCMKGKEREKKRVACAARAHIITIPKRPRAKSRKNRYGAFIYFSPPSLFLRWSTSMCVYTIHKTTCFFFLLRLSPLYDRPSLTNNNVVYTGRKSRITNTSPRHRTLKEGYTTYNVAMCSIKREREKR